MLVATLHNETEKSIKISISKGKKKKIFGM